MMEETLLKKFEWGSGKERKHKKQRLEPSGSFGRDRKKFLSDSFTYETVRVW